MSYELNAMIIDYMEDTLNTKFEKEELKIKNYLNPSPIYTKDGWQYLTIFDNIGF